MESRVVCAVFRLDDFLLNPLVHEDSGKDPETSRNILRANQGTKEDDSQSGLHPKAGVSQSQTTLNSKSDDTYDMVTGVHVEVTYCSPEKYSGKQTKISFVS